MHQKGLNFVITFDKIPPQMFAEPSISKVYGMTYNDIYGISWINARNYKNIAAQPMKFFQHTIGEEMLQNYLQKK